jgi:hypothetical protein
MPSNDDACLVFGTLIGGRTVRNQSFLVCTASPLQSWNMPGSITAAINGGA